MTVNKKSVHFQDILEEVDQEKKGSLYFWEFLRAVPLTHLLILLDRSDLTGITAGRLTTPYAAKVRQLMDTSLSIALGWGIFIVCPPLLGACWEICALPRDWSKIKTVAAIRIDSFQQNMCR